jgi:H+/gluconate symporter-like permease
MVINCIKTTAYAPVAQAIVSALNLQKHCFCIARAAMIGTSLRVLHMDPAFWAIKRSRHCSINDGCFNYTHP